MVGEAWPSRASVEEELPVAALVMELPASVASYFIHKSYKYISITSILMSQSWDNVTEHY